MRLNYCLVSDYSLVYWNLESEKKKSFDFTGCNKERLPLEGFPLTPLEIWGTATSLHLLLSL